MALADVVHEEQEPAAFKLESQGVNLIVDLVPYIKKYKKINSKFPN